MPRVTTKIFINNTLINIFKNFKKIQDANLKIASGKKINKPSDDPIGMANAMGFRKTLSNIKQLEKNITKGLSWLNLAEASLAEIEDRLIEVNQTAVQFVSGTNEDTTLAVPVIDGFISDIIGLGNTSIQNRYIFGGFKTDTQPFTSAASGTLYFGDNNEIRTEFDFGINMPINIPGSDFLAVDLNPDINGDTLLSSLNKGSGISAGSISITDRAGNSATIDLTGLSTVSQVINAISGASGINVTARINGAGTGITIEDDNSSITGNLTVSEAGNGTAAGDLGILGSRAGNLEGRDLDVEITSTTPLSLLYGGNGLSLTDINIANGALSGAVTFSSLTASSTIGDVINIINSSGLNVTAGINSNGTALTITSTDSSSVAIVNEVGTGSAASDLGIGGSKNIFVNLQKLRDALQASDRIAISATIDNIKQNIDNISKMRGIIGGRINRLEISETFLAKREVDTTSFLSDVEDTDIEAAALELITFQTAYEVTLASASQIVRMSILDFLK